LAPLAHGRVEYSVAPAGDLFAPERWFYAWAPPPAILSQRSVTGPNSKPTATVTAAMFILRFGKCLVGAVVVPYSQKIKALLKSAGIKAPLIHKKYFQHLPHPILLNQS
jgi:hypothetical protein